MKKIIAFLTTITMALGLSLALIPSKANEGNNSISDKTNELSDKEVFDTNFVVRHADGTSEGKDTLTNLKDDDVVVLNKDLNDAIRLGSNDITKFELDLNGYDINAGNARPILAQSSYDLYNFVIRNSSQEESVLSSNATTNSCVIFAANPSGEDVSVSVSGNIRLNNIKEGLMFFTGSPNTLTTNIEEGIYFPVPVLDYSTELKDNSIIYSGSISYLSNNFDLINPIKLNKDSEVAINTANYNPNKEIILDLNGYTLSQYIRIDGGRELKIIDSVGTGKVDASNISYQPAVFLLNGKFTLESGEIIGDNFAIAGNGAESAYTELLIKGGTIRVNDDAVAIYHPHDGIVVIEDGYIEGGSAVQMCAGTLEIKGGVLHALSMDYSADKTGDGSILDGAAVSIVDRNYPGGIPTVNIAGGNFISENTNQSLKVYSLDNSGVSEWENASKFIDVSGGIYNTSIDEEFVKDRGLASKERNGIKNYAVGNESIQLLANDVQTGDKITVIKGNVSITNVPEGLLVQNEGNGEVLVNGNIVSNGSMISSCNHQLVHHKAIKPTCIEEGNIEYWTCEKCDKTFDDKNYTKEIKFEDTILKSTGHKLVKTEAKEASCEAEGNIEYYYCEECDSYFTDKDGKYEITKEETVIDKKEHDYKDGNCVICGAKDPSYQPEVPSEPETPKTSDSSFVYMYGLMALLSGLILVVLKLKRSYSK